MRCLLSTSFLLAAALILPVPVAHAATETFIASLNGANDGTPSLATGLATVILDPVAQTLQINATFSGLTSNTMAAHIHCCAPLGTNAGVATTVPTFPAVPPFSPRSDQRDLHIRCLRSHAAVDLQPSLHHRARIACCGRGSADRRHRGRDDLF